MHVFISHAGRDRAWAEWAGWQIMSAGHSVSLDTWDWAAGDNFVVRMRDALENADCVLALFSSAYFEAHRYTTAEWSAALLQDEQRSRRLVPVRIEDANVPSLLRPLIAPALFGMPEERARDALLGAVGGPVGPGDRPPHFPGGPAVSASAVSAASAVTVSGPRLPGVLPGTWNVPPRNPSFVGRDGMLIRLREQLLAGGTARIQVLHGIGGVGKTQLLVEYSHRFANDYDLAWWIRADRPELIGEQLAASAAEAGVTGAEAETRLAVRALGRHLRTTGRWLLVFDNAEDADELRTWLPDGPGHVLISSRTPGWPEVGHVMEVELFARRESVALLRRQVSGMTKPDADRLAAALADLPLAVAQAAAILAETGMPVAEYLDLLETEAARILDDGRPVSYPASLAAAVALSMARLEAQEPAGSQLLRLCAFLGAAPIPLTLFSAAANKLGEPLSAIVRERRALRIVVGNVGRFGLARVDQEGLQLHPLVQAVVRGQLAEPRQAEFRRIIHRVLAVARPGRPDDPATWHPWARLLPHLLVAVGSDADDDTRAVLLEACRYLLVRGDTRAGLDLARQLVDDWRTHLGPEHPHTLTAAVRVGHGLSHLGRYAEALGYYENVMVTSDRLFGSDHPDTLHAANGVAVNLRLLGNADAARTLNEETLSRRRHVLGERHVDTLLSATNLAADLRVLGDLAAAMELHDKTFRRYREILGESHPDTLRAAHNLAEDLRLLGRTDDARQLEERTLAERREVLGEDHPDTLRSALHLAEDQLLLGNTTAAHELAGQTLPRLRKVLGDDDPDMARCLALLAEVSPPDDPVAH